MSDPNSNIPLDSTSADTTPTTSNDTNTSVDPNTGLPIDPNQSRSQDATAGLVNTQSITNPTSVTAVTQPSVVPNAISGSGTSSAASQDNNTTPAYLDSGSANFRKAIIIASAVSGAVGLILIVLVIFYVYRRRHRRRPSPSPPSPFIQAAPRAMHERSDSDGTWVSSSLSHSLSKSFDESKLEAGMRTSEAHSLDSEATLADMVTSARAKSGAFSTPTHTPRPSVEKLKVSELPLVPEDPFEAPRLSMGGRPRPSFEQAEPQLAAIPISAAVPRARKASAQLARINSSSTYKSDVVVEQDVLEPVAFPEPVIFPEPSPARPSPGALTIDVPLVTPVLAPADWRAQMNSDNVPPMPEFGAAKRDSMASLSRQSSRASSRNSFVADEVVSPTSKKSGGAFGIIARKRRSKADSIDPFRKSGASVLSPRRKSARSVSRDGGVARRKSSRAGDHAGSPISPSTGRRKSTRRSASRPLPDPVTVAIPNAGPSGSRPRTAGIVTYGLPRTPRDGLPSTPRTPTAARRSRVASSHSLSDPPMTPRTAPLPAMPQPPTPRARAPLPQPPVPVPVPQTPATAYTVATRTPVTPAVPRELPQTPRTPGGSQRRPRAPLPQTPTSADIYWPQGVMDAEVEPMPMPPMTPLRSARPLPAPPRPLPSAPLPREGGKAELSARGLSRTLSEVSHESPV